MRTRQAQIQSPSFGTTLTLVLLSDTHELHKEIDDVPPGDILIHAGDFTLFSRSLAAVEDFNAWLGELPHPHKICIPGNHEYFLECDSSRRSLLSNAIVLINEGTEIEGLRIWGIPAIPLYGGAFGHLSAKDRERQYAQVPADTDVLITHGPPHGILDAAQGSTYHSGCRELLDCVRRIRPRLHAYGHIHGAYGIVDTEHTIFANVALAGKYGGLVRRPMVLKITSSEAKR